MNDLDQATTLHVIETFNRAFQGHDIIAMLYLMSEDCVFENTYPPPDGERIMGVDRMRKFWENFFIATPSANFIFEEVFACGNRGVARWTYSWLNADKTTGHVRGVDIFRVENGKIREKFSYVKG